MLAVERSMPHIAGAFLRDAERDELIVVPARAVDEHAIGAGEGVSHVGSDFAKAGRVEKPPATRDIRDFDPDVVARRRPVATRRVWRRIAFQRERRERETGHRRNRERLAAERNAMLVDAAVVPEYPE